MEKWLEQLKTKVIVRKMPDGRVLLIKSGDYEKYRDNLCIECGKFDECEKWMINWGDFEDSLIKCYNKVKWEEVMIKDETNKEGEGAKNISALISKSSYLRKSKRTTE